MLWAPFLHIYQPPTQFKQVLSKITKESYFKIIQILKKGKGRKLTLNICASLTEQLGESFPRVISELKKLVKSGQVELAGSAAYHPLLSKLPKTEIERQIKLNSEINKKYFGKFAPFGLFPPEMAYSPQVGDVLEDLGFTWVLLEEFAYPGVYIARDKLFKRRGKNLFIFFRERELSLKIAFSEINSIFKLKRYLGDELQRDGYLITAMDGETFGHHQKGQDKFLEELYKFSELPSVTVSEILKSFTEVEEVEPILSSWGISFEDCRAGRVYPRWDLSGNPLHKLQWKLTDLAIQSVNPTSLKLRGAGSKKFTKARKLLDKALHSDQYWWASHNPHWHYKMMMRGAEMLTEVVQTSPVASKNKKQQAVNLKDKITKLGLALYGDTVIED